MSAATMMLSMPIWDFRDPPPKWLFVATPLIPIAIYFLGLRKLDPYCRVMRGRYALQDGYSVEDFRELELQRSKDYLDPLHRFTGRRNLEKVCEMLSHERNQWKRMRGEVELPLYQPVLEPWSQILARLGPMGPSHLYKMIRE